MVASNTRLSWSRVARGHPVSLYFGNYKSIFSHSPHLFRARLMVVISIEISLLSKKSPSMLIYYQRDPHLCLSVTPIQVSVDRASMSTMVYLITMYPKQGRLDRPSALGIVRQRTKYAVSLLINLNLFYEDFIDRRIMARCLTCQTRLESHKFPASGERSAELLLQRDEKCGGRDVWRVGFGIGAAAD